MSPPRTLLLALGLASTACATEGIVATPHTALPPPAREIRGGARDPGAAPALASTGHAAAPAPGPGVQGRKPPHDLAVRRALETATVLLGRREIVIGDVRYGDDCAALVRAALEQAGSPLPTAARNPRALYQLAAEQGPVRRGRPVPGDVVFLADRPGGPAEHVGLVESISADGTALVLHRTERGVLRIHVNLTHPWQARSASGRWLNDVLLVGAGRVTAGRLVVGFATLL